MSTEPKPIVTVERTSVGPRMLVAGVQISWALGCVHDEEYERLAAEANAAIAARSAPALGDTHAIDDWRIDQSTGRPILVYKDCSVIEAEQAHHILGLLKAAASPRPSAPACHRCGDVMTDSKAFTNAVVGSPDFPGEDGTERGCTMNYIGRAQLVDCLKCEGCGRSIT